MLAAVRVVLLLVLLGLLVDAALVQATRQRRSPRLFTEPTLAVHDTSLPFLGVTVELEQYATQDERRDALTTLHDARFRWVRQRVDWSQIEPQPGRFNWAQSDALLRDILAADLVPLVVLDGSPAWARAPRDADNPLAPPQHPRAFADFVAAFATRYRTQVRFYQLWDEPNIAPHWGNRRPDPVAYAQMLSLASPALRAADPDIGGSTVIALAALAPTADRGHTALDEPYFLRRLYAAGAAPHFDAVAVQPFGFGTRPNKAHLDAAVLNLHRADLVRRTMVAAGDGATPVWAVRYGWSRAPASAQRGAPFGTVSPYNQRDFATAALDFAAARPWLTTMGWAVDQPAAPSDPLRGFALTDGLRAEFSGWSPPNGDLDSDFLSAPREAINKRSEVVAVSGAVKICHSREGGNPCATGKPSAQTPKQARLFPCAARQCSVATEERSEVVQVSEVVKPHHSRKNGNSGWLHKWIPAPRGCPAGMTRLAGLKSATPVLSAGLVSPSVAVKSTGVHLLATLALLTIALQRTAAAVRILPWQTAHRRYRTAPVWVRAAAWLTLLTLYHLATWPPLIVLCWGLAALGMAAQPRLGLALAAATLPFHFWHKALPLPGATVAVAPSQAALGCLAAGLVFRCVRWRFFVPWTARVSGLSRQTVAVGQRGWMQTSNYREPLEKIIRVYLRSSAIPFAKLSATDWLTMAWLVVGLLGARNVWHAPAHREGLLDLVLAPLGLYAATRLLVHAPKARRQLGGALLLGGVLTAAAGLWSWSRGGGEVADGVRRLVGPHFSANHTALYLERSLWLGAGLWLGLRGRLRWLVGGGVVLAATALGLTVSRGALGLGVPAGCLLLGILWWQSSRTGWLTWCSWGRGASALGIALAVAAGAIAAAAAVLLSSATLPSLGQRLLNSATLLDRLVIWRTTLSLWGEFPLLGTGAGGFAWRYPAFLPVQPLDGPLDGALLHPHNVWLEFASIYGALGLAWLLALLLVVVRHARRAAAQRDWLAVGLVAALGAGLVHAQVDAFAALADLAGWLWIALALLNSDR